MAKYSNDIMQRIWDIKILDVADKLEIKYGNKGLFRKCRCFMHEDKHPSMWFKVSNNTWSCPVCGKGGGIVSLVREHENLSFDAAVDWLIKAFDIWVYDDDDKYRPLKSSSNQQHKNKASGKPTFVAVNDKKNRNAVKICPDNVQPLNTCINESTSNMNLLDNNLISQCLSTDNMFCRSLVSTGILTEDHMLHAASLYQLGTTRDGGVIFWSIDSQHLLHEGKIMWYTDDCHRDHRRNPTTVSSRLIKQCQLSCDWTATRCFFGLHLLSLQHDDENRVIAIVESEKTALICSELMPSHLWLSCGGLNNLLPEMFLPIKGHKIVVFPDTDLSGDAYKQWTVRCKDASRLIGQNIYVSNLLERHATKDQKRRKIDIADFIIESKVICTPQV